MNSQFIESKNVKCAKVEDPCIKRRLDNLIFANITTLSIIMINKTFDKVIGVRKNRTCQKYRIKTIRRLNFEMEMTKSTCDKGSDARREIIVI